MRILIIEAGDDKPGFLGFAMQKIIKELPERHVVTLVKGLASLKPLVGLVTPSEKLAIDMPLDLAIVDALIGEKPSGRQIIAYLRRRGIVSIADAALPAANKKLQLSKANVVTKKTTLLGALYYRAVNLSQVCLQPEQFQAQLDEFCTRYEQCESLRKPLERIAVECLQG
jgi:hypothetical protein